MKIEIEKLQRIAKARPKLKLSDFLAVWQETLGEKKRARDRDRMATNRRQSATNERDNGATIERLPATREEQEKHLFEDAKKLLGPRCGGLITSLLKQHNYDIAPVRAILTVASTKQDPKEYVAAACRRQGNGTGTSPLAAVDGLIAREKARTGVDDGPLLDLTPSSSGTG